MINGPKFGSLLFPTEIRIGEAFRGLPHRIHWTCVKFLLFLWGPQPLSSFE